MLAVDNRHTLYWEESGNSSGIPVVFLHGGPGAGVSPNHRRFFDPDVYRIFLFDQRGAGRSTPYADVEDNTTEHLISDIEKLRKKFDVKRWLVFGGSWGATLALLYAEHYPEKVSGMILRGTFLARDKDMAWFVRDGANKIYPDYWQEFLSIFSEKEKNDLLGSMYEHIFSADRDTQVTAAKAWSLWAGRVVTHCLEGEYNLDEDEDEEKLINDVKIEIHYAKNKYFINENQIVSNIKKIDNVPIIIIHGENDITCMPESSCLIHKLLPDSKLILVPNAGHLAGEPAITDALIHATDDMFNLINE